MKTCKRCFREFEEEDVPDVSPAMELADYLDSRFHGNDKEDRGNDSGGKAIFKATFVYILGGICK